jgi:hypothetical protein
MDKVNLEEKKVLNSHKGEEQCLPNPLRKP